MFEQISRGFYETRLSTIHSLSHSLSRPNKEKGRRREENQETRKKKKRKKKEEKGRKKLEKLVLMEEMVSLILEA